MESRRLAVILVIARQFVSGLPLFSSSPPSSPSIYLYSSCLALAYSLSLLFSSSAYHRISSPILRVSAYGSAEKILVMLGLDIIPGDERSNGFMEQITCIIFALIRSTTKWPVIHPTFDSGRVWTGEMRFLAPRFGRRNSWTNALSTH